jgi:hypothetical protein
MKAVTAEAYQQEVERRLRHRYPSIDLLSASVREIFADEIKAEMSQEREKAAAPLREFCQQRDALMPLIRRSRIEGWIELAKLITRTFRIEPTWKAPEGLAAEGAGGYADTYARNIHVPYLRDARAFAIFLHEAGHVVANDEERCSSANGHQGQTSGRWWHCVRCERRAWEVARRLLFPYFDKDMYAELNRGLSSYRRTTPASESEGAATDRMLGARGWTDERLRQLTESWSRERLEALER